MSEPIREKGKDDDPFLRIAIPFILGVVLGFTLVLLGFIFLVLAGLSALEDSNETPAWVWLLAGVLSEVIGVYMMRKTLAGSPTPGSIDSYSFGRESTIETKSKEDFEKGVDAVFGPKKNKDKGS